MLQKTDNSNSVEHIDDKAIVVDMYTAVISYSESDRTDIAYIGTKRDEAINSLWKDYNDYYVDNDPENNKYKKKDFIKAAENNDNSAYIQLAHAHINFELHKNTVTLPLSASSLQKIIS